MTASLMPNGRQQYFNTNTVTFLAGGKVYTYAAGTSTPKATYTTAAANVPNSNPVILDARGEATIFWEGAYDVSVHDANDVPIYTIDNYIAAQLASAGGFANVVVNGSFDLARNIGPLALTGTPTIQTVDDWYVFQNSAAAGISAQVASGLDNVPYCLKLGRNSTNSSTNSIGAQSGRSSADSICLAGKMVVFSFYAKAGADFSGANINVAVFTGTGTDESPSIISGWTGAATPIATTQTITTSWVRYQFTATLSSSATQVGYRVYYDPSGTAGADDNLFITGFDLREGSVATELEQRPRAYELLLALPYTPVCGRLSNLIDAAGPLGASDPFIKCHFIPYNGNQILINGRVEHIPDGQLAASGGIIADYRSCYVDKVASQTLADNTIYFVYVFMLNGRVPTITFSTTGYLQNGALYGNAVKIDDPTCTLIGICRIKYVGGVPTTYGGARGQTISSYFNRFRASLLTGVAGPVASVTQVQLPDIAILANGQPSYNFLEWVQWYDETPRVKLAANVGVSSAGAGARLGIGTNSRTAITGFTAKCVVPSTADNTQHLTVLSGPTDATGYYYAQVLGYSTAGTLQADGYFLADGVMV